MTQFMLCVQEPLSLSTELGFRPVSDSDAIYREAARALFQSERPVQVPFLLNGPSVAELFTDAHNAVYNGADFHSTHLSSVLPEMLKCQSFALWWGDDWSDLPVYETKDGVVMELIKQLREPVGEVYLRWQRSRNASQCAVDLGARK